MSNKKETNMGGLSARREFLKVSSKLALTGGVLAGSPHLRMAHAGGDDTLRVGLIGCGGRGTGAANQAMRADKNVRLTAMGDLFEDRLQMSLRNLKSADEIGDKIDVPGDRQFVGFDAYKQVLESGVDVILLATPPHFRPAHFAAAIAAGKHVFAEKPVAVDAPGVRSVLETTEVAREKGQAVVSGLCLRYDAGFKQAIGRLHDGAIGEIHTVVADDYRGSIWVKTRKPDWTDMHWQLRNWYYYTWLSGDFNVEQHVHYLDVAAWMLGGYPTSAVGMGGRQVRTGEKFGNIFDHHGVTYEYENGAQLFSHCRQQTGCSMGIGSRVQGTKGHAVVSESRLTIDGPDGSWKYEDEPTNMYQVEHDRLFASIRDGKPINNGQYMAHSTLLAIMGRMATYTGQKITWEEALNSQEKLGTDDHQWGPAPEVVIARPGITKFL